MRYDFNTQIDRRSLDSTKWLVTGDDALALGIADMDFLTAPCIREALTEVAKRGIYGYTIKPDPYYDAVIGWYGRHFGTEVKREWMLNVPGVWTAARLSFQIYTKPGDRILVHSPYFHPIISCIKGAGCIPVTESLLLKDGRYEVDLEHFEKTVKQEQPKVFFLVNPQNPTGRSFTREELTGMVRICRDNGVVVVSDEVHACILLDGHEFISSIDLERDLRDNVVLITSASKGYNINGLTYCYLIIPDEELRAKFNDTVLSFNYDFAVNTFSVAATTAAYSEEADEWLKQCNDYIQDNLNYLTGYIEQYIPEIKVVRPESSFLVWLDCRALELSPQALRDLFLNKAGVALTWGETYGPDGEGFERINIACPRKTLEEAMKRIQRAISGMKRGSK